MRKFNKNKTLSKLKFYRNKYAKYIMSVSLAFVIIFVTAYFSFSKLTSIDSLLSKNNILKIEDNNLSYYYNDEKIETMPEKGTASVDKIVCNNDATGVWNQKNWNITISNVTKSNTRCSVYFKNLTLVDLFLELTDKEPNIFTDEYGNIRTINSNSGNWISFNGENWRVVGLFKDIEVINDDGSTKKEDLVKIVRNEPLGNIPWDSNNQNDWTNSTLMTLLNGDYLDNEGTYTQSSTIKSLANEIDKIATVRWNLGAYDALEVTPKTAYEKERGTTGSGKNPSVTTWDGKVALLYPSDYGYAATGEVVIDAETNEKTSCLNITMDLWNNNGCAKTSWINNNASQFLLTAMSDRKSSVYRIQYTGNIAKVDASATNQSVRPALYLKSNAQLIDYLDDENYNYFIDYIKDLMSS